MLTGIKQSEGDVLFHTCVKCNHLNHISHVRLSNRISSRIKSSSQKFESPHVILTHSISWSILGPYSYSFFSATPLGADYSPPVYKLYRRGIMSLGIRPILRPVVWSDVDSNGKLKRPDPCVSSDDDADAGCSSSRKKMKAPAHATIYHPPPLSPSEQVWSKRCEFLLQKGYQLRPRYQPHWNATLLGNGTRSITAEDHIMQIVCVFHSCIYSCW